MSIPGYQKIATQLLPYKILKFGHPDKMVLSAHSGVPGRLLVIELVPKYLWEPQELAWPALGSLKDMGYCA